METIKRNKKIIAISIIVLVSVAFCLILSNSSVNGAFSFHYVYNLKTGEQFSLFVSILLYVLFWWFAGILPTSIVFLFSLLIYIFLHRKDKRILGPV